MPDITSYDPIHLANLLGHISFGLIAIALGVFMLARRKGDRVHKRWGRVYVALMSGLLITAVIGLAFFRRDAALGAVTVLVSYELFSGFRAASGRSPQGLDTFIAVLALIVGGAFCVYLLSGGGNIWRPAVTGPIAGALLLVATYDLGRLAAPVWRARHHHLEHGVKMIATMGGMTSAAFGTVAPQLGFISQLAPSAFFSLFAVGYVLLRAFKRPRAAAQA